MQNINLFIPNSFLAETNDLKIKTYKVGIISRALAVFRIKNVIIYKDNSFNDEKGIKDAKFIETVLNYMNTPQYLRKRAFPIQSDLRHVGILPPLRTPHHPTVAFCKEQLSVNKIFSFKVTKIAKEIIVTPDEPDDIYWGYKTINKNDGLKKSLNKSDPNLVVITTRYAETINSIFDELRYKINKSNNIAIVVGGPYSSVENDYSDFKWESIEINTIPEQGTQTVRTEEAVVATLSLFNILLTD